MDLAYAGLQKVQELAEPYLNDWLQKQAEEQDGSSTKTITDPNTKAKKKTANTKKHTKEPVRKRVNVYAEMRRQEEEYLYGKPEGTYFAGSYERSGDDEVERAHDIEEGIERDIAGEWPLSRPGSPFSFAGSDLLTSDNVERGNRIRERRDRERKDRDREHGRKQDKRKENPNNKFAMDSSEPVPESGRKWGGLEDEADNKMMDDISFDMFKPTMAPLMLGGGDVPVPSDEDDEKYMDAEDYQNRKLLGRLEEYNKRSYDEQRLEEKERSFWEKQEEENMRRYKEERLEEKERRFWKKREEETEERLRRQGYPIAQEQGFMSAKQEAEPDKRNSKAPYQEQDLLREHHHPQRDHGHNQQLFAYRPHPDHRPQHTQPHNSKPGVWERRTVYTIDSSPSESSIPSSSSSSTNDVDWRRGEKRRKPEIPRPPRPVAAGFSLTFDSRHFASFTDDSRSVVHKEELKEAKKEVTIPKREALRRPNNLPVPKTSSSAHQQRQEQDRQETKGEVTSSKGKLKETEEKVTTFQETSRRRSEFPTLTSNFPESRQRRPEGKEEEKQETRGEVTRSEEDKLDETGGEATTSEGKLKAIKDEGKTSEKETSKHPNLLPPLKTNFPSRQRRQRREEQEGQKEQKEQKEQKLRYQKPKSLEFVLEFGNPIPSRPDNADN